MIVRQITFLEKEEVAKQMCSVSCQPNKCIVAFFVEIREIQMIAIKGFKGPFLTF